ncbi:MAG: penicillin-binding protein 1C [Alphaproteobacteria bacterium]|nr:penicillin-binding protein 1C [Alphaproteobacteria bacterium]
MAGALALTAAAALSVDRLCPPDLSRLRNAGTEIDDRERRVIAFVPTRDGTWRLPVSADAVSPVFLRLLITVEDRRFYHHAGVDPLAAARATWQWLRAGRVVSGASTLTMQVARLLEPRRRSFGAKLIEAFRAVQLEARYGKREILGMWLTLAPFGGNLEGVTAASYAWFGHAPSSLTPAEAALLVALPRRPEALRPDRHPDAARIARGKVLQAGIRSGVLDPRDMDADTRPVQRLPLPRAAPQLSAALARAGGPGPVVTTIDLPLQLALERIGTDQFAALPPRTALALLIADAHTREIRALVGGAPWSVPDRAQRAASLDLSLALRSPGSALKPFIYAMAFADGYASPQTELADLPAHFGDYAPEDFTHSFAGRVTAAEALGRSLNLPAVELLRRVGPLRFATALDAAGNPLRWPAGAAASLPLALGGAGVRLRDVAALYAALATDGSGGRLALVPRDDHARRPFLDPQAASAVADILTRPFPGGGPDGVAWKTGTSWGARDAWAFGFDARHVVGVWVGRPDGTAMPEASGGQLALPLLARIFGILPPAPRPAAPNAPLRPSHGETVQADGLRLLFPPPGAVISMEGSLPIRAMGGRRPLSFLVDGAPISSDRVRRDASWTPPGPGFYCVAVIDAAGATVRSDIRVR